MVGFSDPSGFGKKPTDAATSPLPWKAVNVNPVREKHEPDRWVILDAADDFVECRIVTSDTDLADLRIIVTAVNAHKAMLVALKNHLKDWDDGCAIFKDMRDAVALAEL
jgi:hypothetical protein